MSSFGHPTQVSTQVQLVSTCDYFPVPLARRSNFWNFAAFVSYSQPIRFVRLDSEHAHSDWKFGLDSRTFSVGPSQRSRILSENDNTSAIADHIKTTGHNIKWDHFDILAKAKQTIIAKSKGLNLFQNLRQLSTSKWEGKS